MERNEKMKEIDNTMSKIYETMIITREKQTIIDNKMKRLHKETKIEVVEEEKEKLKDLEQEKEEFDEMTTNALISTKKEILEMRQQSEKEYQEMLVQTLEKKKTIETKLQSMKSRDLSDEKLKWAEESANKSMENVNNEMKDFQNKYFEQKLKLDNYEKEISSFAIELGVEDKLDKVVGPMTGPTTGTTTGPTTGTTTGPTTGTTTGPTIGPTTKVMLAVSQNKIYIQGKEDELYYKEEMKCAKELKKEYNIKEIFDKKSAKKIDWALVSTLENIDSSGTLTMDYLSVIKGESLNGKDLVTSLIELHKKVDIEYVFDDKEIGLLNHKAKACAREANELGIASLVGINERSLFDRMKEGITNRFKNRKLFKKKDEIKQLDKRFEKAKEERMGQYRVNNTTNQFEKNAMKTMEEQQQEIASEIEKMKPDAVIEEDGSEIIL